MSLDLTKLRDSIYEIEGNTYQTLCKMENSLFNPKSTYIFSGIDKEADIYVNSFNREGNFVRLPSDKFIKLSAPINLYTIEDKKDKKNQETLDHYMTLKQRGQSNRNSIEVYVNGYKLLDTDVFLSVHEGGLDVYISSNSLSSSNNTIIVKPIYYSDANKYFTQTIKSNLIDLTFDTEGNDFRDEEIDNFSLYKNGKILSYDDYSILVTETEVQVTLTEDDLIDKLNSFELVLKNNCVYFDNFSTDTDSIIIPEDVIEGLPISSDIVEIYRNGLLLTYNDLDTVSANSFKLKNPLGNLTNFVYKVYYKTEFKHKKFYEDDINKFMRFKSIEEESQLVGNGDDGSDFIPEYIKSMNENFPPEYIPVGKNYQQLGMTYEEYLMDLAKRYIAINTSNYKSILGRFVNERKVFSRVVADKASILRTDTSLDIHNTGDLDRFVHMHTVGIFPPFENLIRQNTSMDTNFNFDGINDGKLILTADSTGGEYINFDLLTIEDGKEYDISIKCDRPLVDIRIEGIEDPWTGRISSQNSDTLEGTFSSNDGIASRIKLTINAEDIGSPIEMEVYLVPKGYPKINEWERSIFEARLNNSKSTSIVHAPIGIFPPYKFHKPIYDGKTDGTFFNTAMFVEESSSQGYYSDYENLLNQMNITKEYVNSINLSTAQISINVPNDAVNKRAYFTIDQAYLPNTEFFTMYISSSHLLSRIEVLEDADDNTVRYERNNPLLDLTLDFEVLDINNTFFAFYPTDQNYDKDIVIEISIVPFGYPKLIGDYTPLTGFSSANVILPSKYSIGNYLHNSKIETSAFEVARFVNIDTGERIYPPFVNLLRYYSSSNYHTEIDLLEGKFSFNIPNSDVNKRSVIYIPKEKLSLGEKYTLYIKSSIDLDRILLEENQSPYTKLVDKQTQTLLANKEYKVDFEVTYDFQSSLYFYVADENLDVEFTIDATLVSEGYPNLQEYIPPSNINLSKIGIIPKYRMSNPIQRKVVNENDFKTFITLQENNEVFVVPEFELIKPIKDDTIDNTVFTDRHYINSGVEVNESFHNLLRDNTGITGSGIDLSNLSEGIIKFTPIDTNEVLITLPNTVLINGTYYTYYFESNLLLDQIFIQHNVDPWTKAFLLDDSNKGEGNILISWDAESALGFNALLDNVGTEHIIKFNLVPMDMPNLQEYTLKNFETGNEIMLSSSYNFERLVSNNGINGFDSLVNPHLVYSYYKAFESIIKDYSLLRHVVALNKDFKNNIFQLFREDGLVYPKCDIVIPSSSLENGKTYDIYVKSSHNIDEFKVEAVEGLIEYLREITPGKEFNFSFTHSISDSDVQIGFYLGNNIRSTVEVNIVPSGYPNIYELKDDTNNIQTKVVDDGTVDYTNITSYDFTFINGYPTFGNSTKFLYMNLINTKSVSFNLDQFDNDYGDKDIIYVKDQNDNFLFSIYKNTSLSGFEINIKLYKSESSSDFIESGLFEYTQLKMITFIRDENKSVVIFDGEILLSSNTNSNNVMKTLNFEGADNLQYSIINIFTNSENIANHNDGGNLIDLIPSSLGHDSLFLSSEFRQDNLIYDSNINIEKLTDSDVGYSGDKFLMIGSFSNDRPVFKGIIDEAKFDTANYLTEFGIAVELIQDGIIDENLTTVDYEIYNPPQNFVKYSFTNNTSEEFKMIKVDFNETDTAGKYYFQIIPGGKCYVEILNGEDNSVIRAKSYFYNVSTNTTFTIGTISSIIVKFYNYSTNLGTNVIINLSLERTDMSYRGDLITLDSPYENLLKYQENSTYLSSTALINDGIVTIMRPDIGFATIKFPSGVFTLSESYTFYIEFLNGGTCDYVRFSGGGMASNYFYDPYMIYKDVIIQSDSSSQLDFYISSEYVGVNIDVKISIVPLGKKATFSDFIGGNLIKTLSKQEKTLGFEFASVVNSRADEAIIGSIKSNTLDLIRFYTDIGSTSSILYDVWDGSSWSSKFSLNILSKNIVILRKGTTLEIYENVTLINSHTILDYDFESFNFNYLDDYRFSFRNILCSDIEVEGQENFTEFSPIEEIVGTFVWNGSLVTRNHISDECSISFQLSEVVGGSSYDDIMRTFDENNNIIFDIIKDGGSVNVNQVAIQIFTEADNITKVVKYITINDNDIITLVKVINDVYVYYNETLIDSVPITTNFATTFKDTKFFSSDNTTYYIDQFVTSTDILTGIANNTLMFPRYNLSKSTLQKNLTGNEKSFSFQLSDFKNLSKYWTNIISFKSNSNTLFAITGTGTSFDENYYYIRIFSSEGYEQTSHEFNSNNIITIVKDGDNITVYENETLIATYPTYTGENLSEIVYSPSSVYNQNIIEFKQFVVSDHLSTGYAVNTNIEPPSKFNNLYKIKKDSTLTRMLSGSEKSISFQLRDYFSDANEWGGFIKLRQLDDSQSIWIGVHNDSPNLVVLRMERPSEAHLQTIIDLSSNPIITFDFHDTNMVTVYKDDVAIVSDFTLLYPDIMKVIFTTAILSDMQYILKQFATSTFNSNGGYPNGSIINADDGFPSGISSAPQSSIEYPCTGRERSFHLQIKDFKSGNSGWNVVGYIEGKVNRLVDFQIADADGQFVVYVRDDAGVFHTNIVVTITDDDIISILVNDAFTAVYKNGIQQGSTLNIVRTDVPNMVKFFGSYQNTFKINQFVTSTLDYYSYTQGELITPPDQFPQDLFQWPGTYLERKLDNDVKSITWSFPDGWVNIHNENTFGSFTWLLKDIFKIKANPTLNSNQGQLNCLITDYVGEIDLNIIKNTSFNLTLSDNGTDIILYKDNIVITTLSNSTWRLTDQKIAIQEEGIDAHYNISFNLSNIVTSSIESGGYLPDNPILPPESYPQNLNKWYKSDLVKSLDDIQSITITLSEYYSNTDEWDAIFIIYNKDGNKLFSIESVAADGYENTVSMRVWYSNSTLSESHNYIPDENTSVTFTANGTDAKIYLNDTLFFSKDIVGEGNNCEMGSFEYQDRSANTRFEINQLTFTSIISEGFASGSLSSIPDYYPDADESTGNEIIYDLDGNERSFSFKLNSYNNFGGNKHFLQFITTTLSDSGVQIVSIDATTYQIRVYKDQYDTSVYDSINVIYNPNDIITIDRDGDAITILKNENVILPSTVNWVSDIEFTEIRSMIHSEISFALDLLVTFNYSSINGYLEDTIFLSGSNKDMNVIVGYHYLTGSKYENGQLVIPSIQNWIDYPLRFIMNENNIQSINFQIEDISGPANKQILYICGTDETAERNRYRFGMRTTETSDIEFRIYSADDGNYSNSSSEMITTLINNIPSGSIITYSWDTENANIYLNGSLILTSQHNWSNMPAIVYAGEKELSQYIDNSVKFNLMQLMTSLNISTGYSQNTILSNDNTQENKIIIGYTSDIERFNDKNLVYDDNLMYSLIDEKVYDNGLNKYIMVKNNNTIYKPKLIEFKDDMCLFKIQKIYDIYDIMVKINDVLVLPNQMKKIEYHNNILIYIDASLISENDKVDINTIKIENKERKYSLIEIDANNVNDSNYLIHKNNFGKIKNIYDLIVMKKKDDGFIYIGNYSISESGDNILVTLSEKEIDDKFIIYNSKYYRHDTYIMDSDNTEDKNMIIDGIWNRDIEGYLPNTTRYRKEVYVNGKLMIEGVDFIYSNQKYSQLFNTSRFYFRTIIDPGSTVDIFTLEEETSNIQSILFVDNKYGLIYFDNLKMPFSFDYLRLSENGIPVKPEECEIISDSLIRINRKLPLIDVNLQTNLNVSEEELVELTESFENNRSDFDLFLKEFCYRFMYHESGTSHDSDPEKDFEAIYAKKELNKYDEGDRVYPTLNEREDKIMPLRIDLLLNYIANKLRDGKINRMIDANIEQSLFDSPEYLRLMTYDQLISNAINIDANSDKSILDNLWIDGNLDQLSKEEVMAKFVEYFKSTDSEYIDFNANEDFRLIRNDNIEHELLKDILSGQFRHLNCNEEMNIINPEIVSLDGNS